MGLMAYVDEGSGDPIIFLHGNPSSSYEWRNVISYLVMGRCIAPDLIGMGDSAKLPNSGPLSYRFVEHRKYLDKFLETIGVRERVTLILHDWGSALGFDWAYRHRDAVYAIAYMEAFVATIGSWDEWPPEAISLFQTIRSDAGEELVLTNNFFVETILPAGVERQLTTTEMAVYHLPYAEPGESRRPTLTWPREIPVAGDPKDVNDIINRYGEWLSDSNLPKLFIEAIPGAMFKSHRDFAKTSKNQQHVTISGSHFVQEDSPDETGSAIAAHG